MNAKKLHEGEQTGESLVLVESKQVDRAEQVDRVEQVDRAERVLVVDLEQAERPGLLHQAYQLL